MKRIGFAVIVVAAMVACQSDQMLPPPNALIRDAGHNGGNHFFAFLQPMVSQPTTNGVFDPSELPIVKVFPVPGSACTDPGITYTMNSGPGSDGSERIRVNAADHNYIVNLHTDKVPVISGCTYRIQVLVGSTELGVADIELFLTQKAAKNITADETLALVDGRTLPIKFWIGVGALCATGADCGQGTAFPDRDNVIVTQNLEAGVFIPAGAVGTATTIIVESVDRRPCFDGLLGQTFQGTPGASGNSCYQFRADPPLPGGKFNNNKMATVGICVDLSGVSEAQEPKIQILQFDAGEPGTIRPLPNAPAPFLPCDPAYQTPIGFGKRSLLDLAAHVLASLVSPRPLFARTRAMVFDLGAGGSTDGFSLFTWGLVTDMAKNAGDQQTAAVGTAVATPPSVIFRDSTGALVDSVPVTFSGSGVTGGVTKSGRDGVPGVAQVGSWTLESAGENTLVASAPAFSSVTPTSLTFTATGTPPLGSLSFIQQPTNTPSGLSITPGLRIAVLDPSGHAVNEAVRVTVGNDPSNPSECVVLQTSTLAIEGVAVLDNVRVNGMCTHARVAARAGGGSYEYPLIFSDPFDITPPPVSLAVNFTQGTSVPLEGAVPYIATVTNNGGALAGVFVQAYIDQGDATRAAGGGVMTGCATGSPDGDLPPGPCSINRSLVASNLNAGNGTLVPGTATGRITVQWSGGIIATVLVPITITP